MYGKRGGKDERREERERELREAESVARGRKCGESVESGSEDDEVECSFSQSPANEKNDVCNQPSGHFIDQFLFEPDETTAMDYDGDDADIDNEGSFTPNGKRPTADSDTDEKFDAILKARPKKQARSGNVTPTLVSSTVDLLRTESPGTDIRIIIDDAATPWLR